MSVHKLNDVEARILGVLIEKAFTTPDQYPLSVNAILNGCNQKSNRNPQTRFTEAEVVVGLQGLVPKFMVLKVNEAGSRVEKYRHQAQKTLGLDDRPVAILAELLMRGPQSRGELRARVHRMVPTHTLDELAEGLERLAAKGYAERIGPGPGSRADRYVQLLCAGLHPVEAGARSASAPRSASETPWAPSPAVAGAASPNATPPVPPAATPHGTPPLEERVRVLEAEVARLRADLDRLLAELT